MSGFLIRQTQHYLKYNNVALHRYVFFGVILQLRRLNWGSYNILDGVLNENTYHFEAGSNCHKELNISRGFGAKSACELYLKKNSPQSHTLLHGACLPASNRYIY